MMIANPQRQQQMSLDEFLVLPDDGNCHEFVRGEVRVMPPTMGDHGYVEAAILSVIDCYLHDRAIPLGWTPAQGVRARDQLVGFVVGGEFGMRFALPDDPHQIRGVDVAYIPAEQYARVAWDRREYFPAVPHLVIEVISPSETANDVEEKVNDYLTGGAVTVWLVYLRLRAISVRSADAPTRLLHRTDTLVEVELLPGFALPLAYLFTE